MIHSVASYNMQAHSPRILEFAPRGRVHVIFYFNYDVIFYFNLFAIIFYLLLRRLRRRFKLYIEVN